MIPIYLKGEITQDSVLELMDRMTHVEADAITLYITSVGGDWNATQVLMDYIEKWFENVDIIISGHCMSSAWRLVLLLKNAGSITVLQGAFACDHLTTICSGITYSEMHNPEEHHKITVDVRKKDSDWWTKLCKQEFSYTAKELKDLRAGKNTYLNKNRMDDILKSATYYRKI